MPEDGYHLARTTWPRGPIQLHPRRQGRSTPTSRSSCTWRPRRPTPPITGATRGLGRSVQAAVFDEGYEAIREPSILDPPDRAGPRARGHRRSRAINPHGEPDRDRARRPTLARARHRSAMGHAERRRAPAVHPDGRGLRRFHLATHDDRTGAAPRLPGGIRTRSTTPSSWWSPTTAAAARVAPTARSTSGGSSTASPTPTDDDVAATSTSSARPASNNHYNTGWAWAFDTPFPYWKRWAGAEGGVADMCIDLVVGADRPAGPVPSPAVRPCGGHRPHALRAARHRTARSPQRLPAAHPSTARASPPSLHRSRKRPDASTQFYSRCSGSGRSTTEGWLA
jgi:hypothetical protein